MIDVGKKEKTTMMKTRAALLALFLLALAPVAHAEDKLIWKSPQATGIVANAFGTKEYCHATIRLAKTLNGKLHQFYNPMECQTDHISNYASISVPLGEPVINMSGFKEATHVRVTHDKIILY